jgi:signal transduction histidine kinase
MISLEQLQWVNATLPRVGEWLYRLFDQEERLQRQVEAVTHELQTRLQSVVARAEILRLDLEDDMDVPETRLKQAHDLFHSTLALSTVILSLRDYMEDYRFIRQPIGPLLQKSIDTYSPEAAQRAIDIRLELAPMYGKAPILLVSADHLQIAFNSLIHNAIKYSFRGGPGRERYVRIAGRPDGDFYLLSIENFGVGITQQEINDGLLFLDGYQGELTEGEYRTGTGKGLYFAKRIIERHDGQIVAQSDPKGSHEEGSERQPYHNRFVVRLPYARRTVGTS